MPIYKLKLLERKQIAQNTIELVFEKPEGFQYQPGQYGGFTLLHPDKTDASGITRRFSLLSAPHHPHLAIATRIQTSAYKRVLSEMLLGDEIKFAGPVGNFTLHDDLTVPAVFIAGGIGITPFYSMIHDATHHSLSRDMVLFYGNQTPADTVYLDELKQLQQQNPRFKLIPTMGAPDPHWQGEQGLVTASLLKKYLPDLTRPTYYVCGSPAMVKALHQTLHELDISQDKIKIEDFPGY